jgi:SAM-dependent methyltransferase
MDVTPVEPSAAMRALRPAHLQPAVDAVAEHLPFDDDTFDAALASVTIHQWKDLASGLREMRRVTRGPVVVLTFDPVALREFWLGDYAPEMMDHECGRMPDVDHVRGLLGGDVIVEPVPIPRDCTDGFAEAFFGRPETLLEEPVRRAQSAWGFVTRDVERQSVERLRTAIASGEWDERHGSLREAPWYEGSLRLIQSLPG